MSKTHTGQKHSNFKFRVHNISGKLSLLFSFVAVLISIWGIKSSEETAEKSGAFDKGEAKMSFAGFIVPEDSTVEVYLGLNFTDSSTLRFVTLPYGVKSTGKKTVEDVHLIIGYPTKANISVDDSLLRIKPLSSLPITREFNKGKAYDQVIFNIDNIHPKFSFNTHDIVFAPKESKIISNLEAPTKDSSIHISYSASYYYKLSILLTAQNLQSKKYELKLSYRNASNLDSLIRQILVEKKAALLKKHSSIDKNFFLVVERDLIQKKSYGVVFYDYSPEEAVLCSFSEDYRLLIVYNTNGDLVDIFDTSSMKSVYSK